MRTLPIVIVTLLCAALGFAAPAQAAGKNPHPSYALARGTCKTGYVGVMKTGTLHHKPHRSVVCEWNPSKFSAGKYKAGQFCPASFLGVTTTGKTGNTIKCELQRTGKKTVYRWVQTKPAPVKKTGPTSVRAAIDPSYTQDPTNPYRVTFYYSAAANGSTLPDGTLTLTIFEHGAVSNAGGCTLNVGGTVLGGTCVVVIPAWGFYDLVTTYSGGTGVASTTGTETVDIEAPATPSLLATSTILSVQNLGCSQTTPQQIHWSVIYYALVVTFSCEYQVNVTAKDSSDASITSGLSANLCAVVAGTCTFSDGISAQGPTSTSPNNLTAPTGVSSNQCEFASEQVTASFAGSSTQAPSTSQSITVKPWTSC